MITLTPAIGFFPAAQAASVYGLLYYDCGSRCDWKYAEGITHFLEHVLFKGARRLSGRALFERVERYGGELNAFTTKDKLGIEFWVPVEALPIALEVLRLLAEEATIAPKAVEKERQVILEELAMYEDIPEEAVLDRFEEVIFTQGGLRHPIIGYREALLGIDAETLRRYYSEQLQRSPWVLLLGGALSAREVEKALRRTGWLQRTSPKEPLWEANERQASVTTPTLIERPINQVHLVLGGIGPSLYSEEGLSLQLVLQALGGPFMNSELSLLLRERHGWCYSVYTFFHGYPEKGIWGVYAGLMPSAYERVLELVTERLRWWQEGRLTSERLQRLKQQFLGRHAIVWERLSFRMQVQGRWLLDKGVPFDEPAWRAVLKALSVNRVVAAARESFLPMWVLALRPL